MNNEPLRREGMSLVSTLPKGDNVVAMQEFEGVLILATTTGAYWYDANEKCFKPIRIEAQNESLISVLKSVLVTLEVENKRSGGAITDTIWYGDGETLFDFISTAIEKAESE